MLAPMHARPLLSVRLNRTEARFRPGEAVSGYLHLDAGSDCQADSLEIAFEWVAHSSTGRHTQRVATRQLDGGSWAKGAHTEFPFAFVVPCGPASYTDPLITVEWQISARGAVDWTEDVVSTAPIEVLPPRDATIQGWNLGPTHVATPSLPRRSRGPLSTLGMVLMGVALLGVVLALGTPSPTAAATLLLGATGLSVLGLAALWQAHRNALATQKTGEVRVSPRTLTAAPGQPLWPRSRSPYSAISRSTTST